MTSAAITDYLNTTHPLGSFPFVQDAVLRLLEDAGMTSRTDEIHDLGGGTVKIAQMHRVGMISLSGAALAHLRALGVFGEYLAALGTEAHKVTILHAAHDVPVDAPPRLHALYRKARAGKLSLSRKSIDPRYGGIERIFKPGVIDGRDTGTLYVAPPSARVRAAVYDKRNERILAGAPDPGPLLRYELRLKHVGATLRDAFDPTALFWHYAAPDLLTRPQGVADWSPQADGYDLPPMRSYSPAERIQRIVDSSLDLGKLFDLADAIGPRGIDYVVSALRARYSRHLAGAPAPSEIPRSGIGGAERRNSGPEPLPSDVETSTLQ